MDQEQAAIPTAGMEGIRSTCPYCGVGCGVVALPDGRVVGDEAHPANLGRLCSKGATLAETLGARGRLLRPRVDGRDADWDQALDRVADGFRTTIDAHGPDSVAFYLSGQLLTEDYYVANKLMKGFIGSANIDTNSRLCMASSVAGHVRAFGEDVVPGTYEDWDTAELVVLVGSNSAWCHPVLHARLLDRAAEMVVIDPRRTATATSAALHLPVRAGSDTALFNGLLCFLADRDFCDTNYVSRHTTGLEAALAAARQAGGDIASVAEATGLAEDDVRRFFEMFVQTKRVMTVYSQGVNQSASGTDKVNAILNCHLATGRIGRPGCGPFSVTGQPNAMGGREVGGLANQLAAHMGFEPQSLDRVRRFWDAPNLAGTPGLKAVDLFDAVADGRIKAIWIAATNPVASMPRADVVREALRSCPLVVVADCWDTDTTALAHVVLPAAGWGEKNGTVTNSERCLSRQRRFRDPPGEARPDWWMFRELARRLGHDTGFDWTDPAAIFREHAQLSAFENDGTRRFDLGGLAGLDAAGYEAMAPRRWPVAAGSPADAESGRLFGNGRFSTPDGRARFVAVTPRGLAGAPSERFPMLLNTGRLRDQWHTMSRTGLVPRLAPHAVEPALRMAPADAEARGIADGALVRVETPHGTLTVVAEHAAEQAPGTMFLPIHWTSANSSVGPVGRLVGAHADPVSGQPELKATPAAFPVAVPVSWHGMLGCVADEDAPSLEAVDLHWSRATVTGGRVWRLRNTDPSAQTDAGHLETLLPERTGTMRVQRSHPGGAVAEALIRDGIVVACLAAAPDATALPEMARLAEWLGQPVSRGDNETLLDGLLPDAGAGCADRTVCACNGIGETAIRGAVRNANLGTVAAVGEATRAGTGCGACKPEIGAILQAVLAQDGRMPEPVSDPNEHDERNERDGMNDASFSTEQQDYLKGFMAGVEARRATLGLPLAPVDGAVVDGAAPSAPGGGPGDEQADAWSRTIAAGGKLTSEEDGKRRRNPLDRFDEVAARARDGVFPKGVDVFLTKWQGLFYVAPNQNGFMCRLRMPGGILAAHQLRGIAALAERCAGGYADVTTRANLQLREIGAGDAVEVLWALADLGLTSRGSGGDNVRNVTGSPTAGIDPQELIDTRPMAREIHHWIMSHRALYGLPRKFNIAFDGGGRIPVLEDTNDIAFTAVTVRGGFGLAPGVYYRLGLGGITGHRDFARGTGVVVAPGDTTAVCDAILHVFIREGDRTDRKKARLKYILDGWGTERFLAEVETRLGRTLLRVPPEACLAPNQQDRGGHLGVHNQKQPGLSYIGVVLPVGRMTPEQMRGLAAIAETHGSAEVRLTVWQNLLIPGIHDEAVPLVQDAIRALGLDWQAGPIRAGLVSCTGAAGCRFAASHTKQHATALADWLEQRIVLDMPLNIHLTGCHNSCAQHFIADIGLLGAKVERGEDEVEGYDLHVGGGAGPDARIGRLVMPKVAHDELGPVVLSLLQSWKRSDPAQSFQNFAAGLSDAELVSLCEAGRVSTSVETMLELA